jgi:hypothetical protein
VLLASCLVVTPGPSVIATTGLNHRLTVGMDRGMNMIEEMLKHAEKSSLETYIKKKTNPGYHPRMPPLLHTSNSITRGNPDRRKTRAKLYFTNTDSLKL